LLGITWELLPQPSWRILLLLLLLTHHLHWKDWFPGLFLFLSLNELIYKLRWKRKVAKPLIQNCNTTLPMGTHEVHMGGDIFVKDYNWKLRVLLMDLPVDLCKWINGLQEVKSLSLRRFGWRKWHSEVRLSIYAKLKLTPVGMEKKCDVR
jgi:hypothetical protein